MINDLIYLVNPSTEYIEKDRPVSPPLGITSLAGYLIKQGFTNVKLDDGYLLGLRSGGKTSTQLIKKNIIKYKPKIFGVSVFSGAHPSAFELLKFAKQKGSVTVAGGADATINHFIYALSGFIDYIIRGEGESTFSELVKRILNNFPTHDVPSLTYYKDGKLVITPMADFVNLDKIPFPARELLPNSFNYISGREITIEESRGCIFNCSFCAIKETNKKVRLKSPKRIKEELESIIKNSNPNNIRFISENVLLKEKRAIQIANIMSNLSIPWMINAHPKLVNLRSKLFPYLLKSGLRTVEIGIESGSDEVLFFFNKRTTSSENSSALKVLSENNIPEIRIEYIMFNPLMSYENFLDSLSFIEHHLEIFLKDPKFPKQLFTEMYVELGVPFFDLVNKAGLVSEVRKSDFLKREFIVKYLDETVLNIKRKVKIFENEIRKKSFDLKKEDILKRYKEIVFSGGC